MRGIESVGNGFALAGAQVAVAAERRSDRRVAQALHERSGMRAGGNGEGDRWRSAGRTYDLAGMQQLRRPSSKRGSVHRFVWIGAALAAVAAVVGGGVVLTRDDGDAGNGRDLLGPGSAIGDEFTVARGSRLVGSRFPQVTGFYDGRPEFGWVALLLVDGDPFSVFFDYVSQAEALGFRMSTFGPCDSRADLLRCDASGDTGPPNARTISVELLRSSVDAQEFASHVVLHLSRPDPEAPRLSGSGTVERFSTPARFEERPRLPELAAENAPIDPSNDSRAVARVASGSELLAPPAPIDGCLAVRAVLRVVDDPGTVVRRYAKQFARAGLEPLAALGARVREQELDGLNVIETRYGATEETASAIAVAHGGGRAYLMVEECHG